MKTKSPALTTRDIKKRLGIWILIVAAVLMIPVVAKWPWGPGDFVFGFVMLFGSATIYEWITKNMSNSNQRAAVGVVVFLVLASVWVMFATG